MGKLLPTAAAAPRRFALRIGERRWLDSQRIRRSLLMQFVRTLAFAVCRASGGGETAMTTATTTTEKSCCSCCCCCGHPPTNFLLCVEAVAARVERAPGAGGIALLLYRLDSITYRYSRAAQSLACGTTLLDAAARRWPRLQGLLPMVLLICARCGGVE